ncbi:MAG TPA: glycosyltransferase family 39 protein, partial [Acidimicrobiales bacterium]|nr:glycosyltransferase family 39 protein [Acidimicrobiales bacterium]
MSLANPPSTVVEVDLRARRAPTPVISAPARRRSLVAVERLLLAVALGLVVVGVVLRFVTHSSLWLDEALTVNIARLPLPQLFAALRQDGSPPLYYLVLHFWMALFGGGDTSVRVLPALISVATLPVAWILGRTVGGRNAAVAALVLLATSPFAIRYATEGRMYSLVMLLSMVATLALIRCLRSPTPAWLVMLGVSGGLLLLT